MFHSVLHVHPGRFQTVLAVRIVSFAARALTPQLVQQIVQSAAPVSIRRQMAGLVWHALQAGIQLKWEPPPMILVSHVLKAFSRIRPG
jgi:hypothetical protein